MPIYRSHHEERERARRELEEAHRRLREALKLPLYPF
jgi:hypothetical protein